MRGVLAAAAAALVLALPAAAAPAPGGPGARATWTTGAKQGLATSTTLQSKIWATLARGGVSEVYWPRLDRPQTADLELIVSDGATFAEREQDATTQGVELVDAQALEYRQVNTARSGRYRIVKTTVTDPVRDVVLVGVRLDSLDGGSYRAYAYFDPALSATGGGDTGSSQGDALVASDGASTSALLCSCRFVRTSSGYAGTASDPLRDLQADGRLDATYDSAAPGNVVQVGDTGGASSFTLALGFGATPTAAVALARASLAAGFGDAALAYETTWQDYLRSLPSSGLTGALLTQYRVALMALRAGEDKTFRGAGVASPTIPWGDAVEADGADDAGYHLVWARDLYEVASAQLVAGDRAAAERALTWLLRVQQNRDGTFPQNTTLDGKPYFTSLQLDEVAFPLVLAWQLGRADPQTWKRNLRPAADVLVARGPATPQERWEEASGYSPSTLAAEIAALVCAADLARRNGDRAAEGLYLGVADDWQRHVGSWTYTSTGRLGPHFERVDDNGNPNDGHALGIANGGGTHDERTVVDAGFLELVRLGVLSPGDRRVQRSLAVVDRTIRVETPNGVAFYRYNHDGYGETSDGRPYAGGGIGRLWPVLTGERGEYELAAGRSARAQLEAMAAFANDGYLIPEQVWDRPDAFGFRFGEGTGSATPLQWSLAQFVRLARDIQAGRLLDRPAVVARRYARGPLPRGPRLAFRVSKKGRVTGTTTAPLVVVAGDFGRTAVRPRGSRFSVAVKLGIGRNRVTVVAVGPRSTTLRRLFVVRRP